MPADAGQGCTLQQIIEQRLFTRVLIFGKQVLGRTRRDADDANVIASARILRTCPSGTGEKCRRKTRYGQNCINHWCAVRARKA
jgi:hypothetical protein